MTTQEKTKLGPRTQLPTDMPLRGSHQFPQNKHTLRASSTVSSYLTHCAAQTQLSPQYTPTPLHC